MLLVSSKSHFAPSSSDLLITRTDWISIWRSVALTSLGFGGLGIIGCFFCQDIGRKMNNKIEIFLENDVQAEKNEFH